MKDPHSNKTVGWVEEKNRSLSAFEKRMDILIFITHATEPVTVKKLMDCVLDAQRITIRACLQDLIASGYVEKATIYTYIPTVKAKQLFGAAA